MPESSPEKKGGRSEDLTPGESKMLLMGILCSGSAKVDFERLGTLMNTKRASASTMHNRALRKLEKVYGVNAQGGTIKSAVNTPVKTPAKKAGGQKRRKKNQDPESESEPEPELELKNDCPEEAEEDDMLAYQTEPTD
ncbi:hypothetical protein PENANT_c020G00359 [Penicillium antarcticum]|uniref:Uncharacterized protein n=1 Tax=Penicillium antarcticum TaxID=416450 RepID=A0A1V6PZY1_9EURO|nr:uncharacterized protein N7508_004335 [Penicillium antarcticum]KAJ5308956.1 hypothetical protein N7508_004335 [Penicillium antarcticum]OQD82604.1 hypothetical protein PENANT_c020G00359 [Penicillium antarcticum]